MECTTISDLFERDHFLVSLQGAHLVGRHLSVTHSQQHAIGLDDLELGDGLLAHVQRVLHHENGGHGDLQTGWGKGV